MTSFNRTSGIRLTLPESLEIQQTPVEPAPSTSRAAGGHRPTFEPIGPPAVPSTEAEEIARALERQDLRLVDTIPLTRSPVAAQSRAALPEEVELEVPLEPDEDTVLLLEQGGMFVWQFRADSAEAPAAAGTRMAQDPAAARVAKFRVHLETDGQAGATRQQRGFLSDVIVGVAKVLVFKFAGRFLVGRAAAFLERNVRPGVVSMLGLDPTVWLNIGDFNSVYLPFDRPSRILLFVHGTFSSTKGGFGGLCATPWGRAFLTAAAANYDAIL